MNELTAQDLVSQVVTLFEGEKNPETKTALIQQARINFYNLGDSTGITKFYSAAFKLEAWMTANGIRISIY